LSFNSPASCVLLGASPSRNRGDARSTAYASGTTISAAMSSAGRPIRRTRRLESNPWLPHCCRARPHDSASRYTSPTSGPSAPAGRRHEVAVDAFVLARNAAGHARISPFVYHNMPPNRGG
jgi:hypothetical protein